MNLDHILVIADREDTRQIALRAALDLTRGTSAQITLVGFVYDAFVEQPRLVSPGAARRLQTSMVRDKQRWLQDARARIATGDITIHQKIVWTKDVAAWVNEHAKQAGFGLLVKAGNRSENLVYTPTDWRLLRESPIPVMIVRDKLRKRPGRIVAAVDLGTDQPSQRALNKRVIATAAIIARQIAAELHVVYAIPLSTLAQDLDLVNRGALERRTGKRLAREIAEVADEFQLPADHIRLKAGPPERVIDGIASKLKATLVVMGTIGRKGLKGKLLGNTAEKVLHRNRATVLALRPDQ